MIRVYLPHVVRWRDPVAQNQHYFGVEFHRLFVGFVLTLDGETGNMRTAAQPSPGITSNPLPPTDALAGGEPSRTVERWPKR